MKKFFVFFPFLLLIIVSQYFSCRPYSKEKELRKTDSLRTLVKKAENTLIVNVKAIEKRYDSIRIKKQYIKESFGNYREPEIRSLLTRYEAIENNYKNFIQNYELLEYENEAFKKKLSRLKSSLVKGELSKKEFREYYSEEKKVIKQHLKQVKKLVGSVAHIELMFRHLDKKIDRIYKRLKQRGDIKEKER